MAREFHDLAELALNREGGGSTAWANLGYWQQAISYPQACEALAKRLADASELRPGNHLLDLGFGCGEQIKLWVQDYGLSAITGLNVSRQQTAHAQQLAWPSAVALHQADARDLARYCARASLDRVLALDCAYHFPDRRAIFAAAFDALRPGGILGLTDLLRPSPQSLASQVATAGLARASRIPAPNLLDCPAYVRQLQAIGYVDVQCSLLESHVFKPFARWWAGYKTRQGKSIPAQQKLKFELTARALNACAAGGWLSYGMIIARKP